MITILICTLLQSHHSSYPNEKEVKGWNWKQWYYKSMNLWKWFVLSLKKKKGKKRDLYVGFTALFSYDVHELYIAHKWTKLRKWWHWIFQASVVILSVNLCNGDFWFSFMFWKLFFFFLALSYSPVLKLMLCSDSHQCGLISSWVFLQHLKITVPQLPKEDFSFFCLGWRRMDGGGTAPVMKEYACRLEAIYFWHTLSKLSGNKLY